MILARTGNDAGVLGIVQSIMGVGGVVGSVVLSIWGGPKRRIHGVLAGMGLGMTGMVLMGLGRDLYVWSLAAFISLLFIPIINGSNQAIWQTKVAPDVQGRVFATRAMIAQISVPVAMLLSGPMADYYFEPAMMAGGSLEPVFGMLVGTGPGAGMALMFVIAGLCGVLIGFGSYAFKAVRDVEDIIPDHQATVSINRVNESDTDTRRARNIKLRERVTTITNVNHLMDGFESQRLHCNKSKTVTSFPEYF
jgi:hypothetical protein